MPTIVTHAAVPLCLGLGLGSRIIPPRLLLAGVAIAMLPDADVLAFKLGVAYGHVFGHRGFTHSLLFAFALPTLAMLFHRQFRASAATVWSFLLVSLLSHSLLDSLTTGGKGVGWLWPWRDERFFAPLAGDPGRPLQAGGLSHRPRRGGDPLRALLGLAAGGCIDIGVDGMAGVEKGEVVVGLERGGIYRG